MSSKWQYGRFERAVSRTFGRGAPSGRLAHVHSSSRSNESTSCGENETVTSCVSPAPTVASSGVTENGASEGGSGSAPPPSARTASAMRSATGPVFVIGNECERVWNIIVGRKASDVVSHSSAPCSQRAVTPSVSTSGTGSGAAWRLALGGGPPAGARFRASARG